MSPVAVEEAARCLCFRRTEFSRAQKAVHRTTDTSSRIHTDAQTCRRTHACSRTRAHAHTHKHRRANARTGQRLAGPRNRCAASKDVLSRIETVGAEPQRELGAQFLACDLGLWLLDVTVVAHRRFRLVRNARDLAHEGIRGQTTTFFFSQHKKKTNKNKTSFRSIGDKM